MNINRNGIARVVILVGDYAIKLPRWRYGWRNFLNGLLANMQERQLGVPKFPALCPVVGSLPGGWLLVMRRARPMSDAEWGAFNVSAFRASNQCAEAAEPKQDSYGVLDGRVVAVDYGN